MRRWLALAALAACGHAASPPASPPGESHATPASCEAIVAHLAIVFGQHDLAAALPRARLEVLEGVGHVPQLEEPRRVARRTEAFLREVGV